MLLFLCCWFCCVVLCCAVVVVVVCWCLFCFVLFCLSVCLFVLVTIECVYDLLSYKLIKSVQTWRRGPAQSQGVTPPQS